MAGTKQLQQSTSKDSNNIIIAGMTMTSMTETSKNQLEEVQQCRKQGRAMESALLCKGINVSNSCCLVT